MRIFIAALLLLPAAALASSQLDGTWKSNVNSVKVTGKPDVYLLADGEYTCSSCDPELKVKADGDEQQVTGHSYNESEMEKMTSPTSDEGEHKLGGQADINDKTVEVTDKDLSHGQTTTYTLEKQQ